MIAQGNVAVSRTGRIFFTFHPFAKPFAKVAEWLPEFKGFAPYPSQQHDFDSVLSLRIDGNDRLWALDYASEGAGRPSLQAFDLKTNQLVKKFVFIKEVAGEGSFLNGFFFRVSLASFSLLLESLLIALPFVVRFSN